MQNRRKILIICAFFVIGLTAGGYGYYELFLKSAPKPRPVSSLKVKETPKEQKSLPAQKESKGIAVPAVTEFSPTTVFSGTLGEVTALQAGRDINKAAFEMKEYQVKLKELEDKLVSIPDNFMLPPSSAPSSPLISSPAASGTPSLAIPSQPQEQERIVVLAVKGLGNNGLTATLRSRSGTYSVKVGEVVPGFGKVSSISRERVIVNNAVVPWM